MKLHVFPCGPVATNAYLLTHPEKKVALLVDVPLGCKDDVLKALKEADAKLEAIVLTHGHWDHTAQAADLQEATGAKIYGHKDGVMLYETPGMMSVFMPKDLVIRPIKVNHWVDTGDHIALAGLDWEVRAVPGHCPGSILIYNPSLGAFVGDAIFQGSVGRTDLPGGDFEILKRSILEQIYTLPSETFLFPGHGEPTSVEDEAGTNPYVRKNS